MYRYVLSIFAKGQLIHISRDIFNERFGYRSMRRVNKNERYIPARTAQGGGGSFREETYRRGFFVVSYGWQSNSTDGSKGGWTVRQSLCLSICSLPN